MTFAAPPRRPSAQPPTRRGPLIPTLVVLGVLVVLVLIMAQIWTEVLWFDTLGFLGVMRTEWFTKGVLFLVGFALMSVVVWLSLRIAYRSRPVYPPTAEQVTLEQYREQIEPLRKLVMIAGPLVLGLFAGIAAANQWQTVQLWLNGVEFGKTDPQFGMDLSFFVFTLPAIRTLVSFLMAAVVIGGIAAIATHYLYGGIRVGPEGGRSAHTTRAARVQLATMGAILMLLVAANYWLDRYSLLTKTGGRFDGAGYADISAVLPAREILTGVAVLVAALFVLTAVRGNWRLPIYGVGLMVVAAVVVGGIYPALVQQFRVDPNAQELEADFIQRNIDATRAAYGLEDIEVMPYEVNVEAEEGALREDAETTASIRLLDPNIVSPTFRQLQQNKQYYNFADTLTVDRYDIEGEKRDTVIGVRELDLRGLGPEQRTWINDHTVYTHGFGVVAAFGNQVSGDGQPAFYQGGIPSTGALGEYEPRIYFGQNSPTYSIVGAPEGTDPWELDYPDDNAPNGQVNSTFPTQEYEAGPSIGNLWNQLLFAIKFGSEQILFSDRVTSESQILYDRNPRDRVAKVAPYLTLDGRVYPAVVDGRVKWIVDGYTTTDAYPYSAQRSLDDATADTLTQTSQAVAELLPQQVNYIRNSVKATVDAYDGSVDLYVWDEDDPVLQTWMNVFPGTVQPMSEITGELMSHLRYPEDLFKVQRELLTRYHVDDARAFYGGQDFWANPADPTAQTPTGVRPPLQPPFYLTLQMPEQDEPTFSLTSTFIPGGNTDRNVLTGFLAVDAETGDQPGKPRDGYGQLRLLELPRDSTVPGPGQVQNNFDSNPTISTELNLLRQGDSEVLNGNLLTLPVADGLLYVQPVYVQSTGGTQYPLLQKVLVAFGEDIGFADTLTEALDQVFGGDAGAEAGDAEEPDVPLVPNEPADPGAVPEPSPGPTEPTTPATPTQPAPEPTTEPTTEPDAQDARARLETALRAANQAIQDGQAALADGDFAAYGEAQERLNRALADAIAAERELG